MRLRLRTSARTVVALAAVITTTCSLGVVAADARSAAVQRAAVAVAPPPEPVEFGPPRPGVLGVAEITAAAPRPKPPAPVIVADEPPAPERVRTPRRPRPPRPAPPACPPTPRVPAAQATRARVITSSIAVYDAPGAAEPRRTLSNPREEDGLPLDFLVRARQGEWIKVQLAVRPNFTYGWVNVRDVELSGLRYRILVERCARRVTVFERGRMVMREIVAVGMPQYPTPLGEFYVDYIYPFSMRSGYGPWLLSVAGFSDVLKTFAGGRGQIAIHGTNATWSLGRAASHGCVRVAPDVSTRLSKMIKPGTPVTITP